MFHSIIFVLLKVFFYIYNIIIFLNTTLYLTDKKQQMCHSTIFVVVKEISILYIYKEPVSSKTFCNISFNINSSRFYF